MRIREVYLKNFGKFREKNINISDGITIIYGENESGKTTVHNFIKSMLFGLERGRGRASLNDAFSRNEPWDNPNFYAGKLKFQSGEKTFSIHRNFDRIAKSAELICLDDGEELSVENGDLEMLLDGMTENIFENTVFIGQLKTFPNQTLAAALQNYATNYYASGDDELEVTSALEYLRKRKKEIEKERDLAIHRRQEKKEPLEQEASYVWREIHRLREEAEILEEELLEQKQKEQQKPVQKKRFMDELRPDNWRIHPVEIMVSFLMVMVPHFIFEKPWAGLISIILFLCCGIYIWNRVKVSKKQEKTESEKLLEEISGESLSVEKMLWKKERIESEIREKEIQYGNLQEQLEEMEDYSEYFTKQEQKKQAIQLAERKILELSAAMQKNLRSRLNARTAKILEEVTAGKYTQLFVENDLKMTVCYQEKRIAIDRLSQGTIEQIYFALRMAAAEFLNGEDQPVIVDDTFVYYDDVRLENTLKWLAANRKQVILFTCQNREEEILKKLNIAYKKETL